MGNFFGNKTGTTQSTLTPRQVLENKYNSSRNNLLLAIAFTLINIVLVLADNYTYFLFSLFVPYILAYTGKYLCGLLPESIYEGEWASMDFFDREVFIVMLVIAFVIIALYFLSWIFSKKLRVGWLIFALVFFSIDTLLLILIQGVSVDGIIDIVFHVWVFVTLINGIRAYFKLKKLPVDEVIESVGESVTKLNGEIISDPTSEGTENI